MLSGKGTTVKLYARTRQEADTLNTSGSTRQHLKDIKFPPGLTATGDIAEAMDNAKAVLMVVPSQSMRENIRQVKDHLTKSMLIISAAKGLKIDTLKRMS